MIFNRRIWSASAGWRVEEYDGKNPHDKHAHFSAYHTPVLEKNTEQWLIQPATPTKELENMNEAEVKAIVKEALAEWAKVDPLASIAARTNSTENKRLPAVQEALAAVNARLDEITKLLTPEEPPAS